MSDEVKKEYKSRILRGAKFQLSAPCPTAKGKYSKLYWDLYAGNPQICVRTNDPADEGNNYGIITAALEMPTFYALMEKLREICASTTPTKTKLECYGHDRPQNGQPRGDIMLKADVWVGQDDQGRIYISVIAKDKQRPVVKFQFGAPDTRYHKFYSADGQEINKSEESKMYCLGMVRMLGELMPTLAVADHTPPPPRPQGQGGWKGNNGGGGGGWKGKPNNSGGGAPSGQRPSTGFADMDDDIPF